MSGVLFFIGDPGRYAIDIGFQLKKLLVIVAGMNAVWIMRKLAAAIPSWQSNSDVPRLARVLAMISLFAWPGMFLFGRLIPYVGTG